MVAPLSLSEPEEGVEAVEPSGISRRRQVLQGGKSLISFFGPQNHAEVGDFFFASEDKKVR
jgi:hypothetical protein